LELAVALIEGGADTSTLSKLGGTALHEAATGAGIEMVQILLESGIDPSIKAMNGDTALGLAQASGNDAVVKLLGERSTLFLRSL
jgi:ankyrin repeat protein